MKSGCTSTITSALFSAMPSRDASAGWVWTCGVNADSVWGSVSLAATAQEESVAVADTRESDTLLAGTGGLPDPVSILSIEAHPPGRKSAGWLAPPPLRSMPYGSTFSSRA